jgi:hypothetical protein
MNNRATSEAFVPRWFSIWLLLVIILLFIGGIADRLGGSPAEGLDPAGAAVGVSIMYVLTIALWRKRSVLISIVSRVRIPLVFKSILVGWSFAELGELVNFPFNPLFPGATLLQDLLLTTPFYFFGHLGWFIVLRRFRFTPAQALLTGGFAFGLFEVFSGGFGLAGVLTIALAFPFVVMIHGPHMVMPRLALQPAFDLLAVNTSKWKYLLGVLLPGAGIVVGVGLAYLIAPLLA